MPNDSSVRKPAPFTGEYWMTVSEAADRLDCAPQTVYVRAVRGELETTQVGKRTFVSRASVQRALQGQGA